MEMKVGNFTISTQHFSLTQTDVFVCSCLHINYLLSLIYFRIQLFIHCSLGNRTNLQICWMYLLYTIILVRHADINIQNSDFLRLRAKKLPFHSVVISLVGGFILFRLKIKYPRHFHGVKDSCSLMCVISC